MAAVVLVLLGFAGGCSEESIQAQGFALPDGNSENGQATFVRLQCHQCHRVNGLNLPAGEDQREGPVEVVLGGPVSGIKTYGDLVTSIINPSHRLVRDPDQTLAVDGQSLMTVYNDVMTVTELVDLVSFLQEKYEVVVPAGNYYPPF